MKKLLLASLTAIWVGATALESVATAQDGISPTWRRLQGPPGPESPQMQCAGRTNSNWLVTYTGTMLNVQQLAPLGRRRDPLPYDVDFTEAIDTPPPAPPAPDGTPAPASRSGREWARNYARDRAGHRVVPVTDGWLIGFDAGEYGGSLWWYPAEPGPGLKLWDRNVGVIEASDVPDAFIVFSGLNHMELRRGAVLMVSRVGGVWGVRSQSAVDGRVAAHTPHPDGWLAVTATQLLLVARGGAVATLARIPDTYAPPISLALSPNGDIAIGRRFFVSVLAKTEQAYHETWFLPPACRRFRDGLPCVCTGV